LAETPTPVTRTKHATSVAGVKKSSEVEKVSKPIAKKAGATKTTRKKASSAADTPTSTKSSKNAKIAAEAVKKAQEEEIELTTAERVRLERGEPLRGRAVSGRAWKQPVQVRQSKTIKVKPLTTSWKKKMRERQERQIIKEKEQMLNDLVEADKEKERLKREQRKKQREENERRGAIYQKVGADKLKKMSRKQIRNLQKV